MTDATEIKEDEIRPDHLFNKFMNLGADDAQNFFKSDDLVNVDCPACGGSDIADSFEKLLLSRGEKTLESFQKFLAEHVLSSHVWIVCHKN